MTETDTRLTEIPVQVNGLDYFSQNDPQWGNEPYSITRNPNQTIGTSGCVPTLQAVLLANLRATAANPLTMANWNLRHGFRTAHNGTRHVSWDQLVADNELRQDRVAPDGSTIRAALEVGGFIVAFLKAPDRAGLGTPGGHVIGIHKAETDGLRVIDTNSPAKSQLKWSLASILPFVSAELRHIYVT